MNLLKRKISLKVMILTLSITPFFSQATELDNQPKCVIQNQQQNEIFVEVEGNNVRVSFKGKLENDQGTLIITNQQGQVLFNEEVEPLDGQVFQTIEKKTFGSGLFNITLRADGKDYTKQITIK